MRILWSSNAPWVNSGYGVQTRHIVPRLQQAGHQCAIAGFCGVIGALINRDSIPIYPAGNPNAYGFDVLPMHSQHWQADIAISLIDAWTANPEQWPSNLRWVPYFPIDSEPCSPRILERVSKAYDRIVFSKFACRELERAGLSYHYAPHVTDTSVYCPGDQAAARAKTGMPRDQFIVGIVAANKGFPPRKSWPQMLEAWCLLAKEHADTLLYLHTTPGQVGDSFPIQQHLEFLSRKHGVDMNRRVMWIDQYLNGIGIPDEYMADAFRSIDVLLNPAMGEGFGVPILEAQACGTPVIVGDWTAMSELAFAGWTIDRCEATAQYIPGYDTEQYVPDIDAIHDRLEHAYLWARGDRTEKQASARKGAIPYDVDTVMRDHWLPTIEAIQSRVKAGHGELKMVSFA